MHMYTHTCTYNRSEPVHILMWNEVMRGRVNVFIIVIFYSYCDSDFER